MHRPDTDIDVQTVRNETVEQIMRINDEELLLQLLDALLDRFPAVDDEDADVENVTVIIDGHPQSVPIDEDGEPDLSALSGRYLDVTTVGSEWAEYIAVEDD